MLSHLVVQMQTKVTLSRHGTKRMIFITIVKASQKSCLFQDNGCSFNLEYKGYFLYLQWSMPKIPKE